MRLRVRRLSVVMVAIVGVIAWVLVSPESYEEIFSKVENTGAEIAGGVGSNEGVGAIAGGVGGSDEADVIAGGVGGSEGAGVTGAMPLAAEVLEKLEVKGRAPKTGYARTEFYDGWPTVDGCSLRQRIIKREFGDSAVLNGCDVVAGEYDEPYTGKHMVFTERSQISDGVQIDHVVALSDAWQKGAQYQSPETRYAMATDPLNLLAVDGPANKQKSDGDAATWLPANKKFRCQYVARQVSVKYKYGLWVTKAEKEAISRILAGCPEEPTVGVNE